MPPYLLSALGAHLRDGADRAAADPPLSTLAVDRVLRERRNQAIPERAAPGQRTPVVGLVDRRVARRRLPGPPDPTPRQLFAALRVVDDPGSAIRATLALFDEVFGRSSYDDRGAEVVASVHYRRDYDNAFWDGTQLVVGDGDGRVFDRFTGPVDVLAHELTHAVTQFTAALAYRGQSGALNESISDVFAAMVKQRLRGQRADQADWLIGAGLFRPGVRGRALRDMAAPGTAYDDPALGGRDPQPDTMAGYVETADDHGGVHLNSGIPNRAFQLVATGLGGSSWERAGQVWYAALTSGLDPEADFAGFAAATVSAAQSSLGSEVVDVVRRAWGTVGVLGAGSGTGSARPRPARSVVAVRRSGGFAGLVTSGSAVLGEDPRTEELQQLVPHLEQLLPAGPGPGPGPGGEPGADRFVYAFELADRKLIVAEHRLTPELHQLARLLLDAEGGGGAP